ncbi:MAG: phosphoenolpyruvate carboxykinase domain-containing protein, partial [Gammaproteobacteria bacterium]
CGKTNFAMLIPPKEFDDWKVTTVGDDIAWIHKGKKGGLHAINPEAGYFGVVPGTAPASNRNAYEMIRRDTLFTNVALTADHEPWWEGRPDGQPVIDWQGRPYAAGGDPKKNPAAHPNSRFTVAAKANPWFSPSAESPAGVPLSAIVFGGRRRELAPLVYEARDWQHGVLVGASVASETTAAATGAVGVVRRDPMAMKPFAGYHFGDYWQHWLDIGKRLTHPPRIFHVNWFRQGANGKFLWPGFGDNLRVLKWMLDRVNGLAAAHDTAIGHLPRPDDLDLTGLDLSRETLEELLAIDATAWRRELDEVENYLKEFAPRTPAELHVELGKTLGRLD